MHTYIQCRPTCANRLHNAFGFLRGKQSDWKSVMLKPPVNLTYEFTPMHVHWLFVRLSDFACHVPAVYVQITPLNMLIHHEHIAQCTLCRPKNRKEYWKDKECEE